MSEWKQPEPPPVEHPEFTPIDVDDSKMTDDQRYYITLVRQSLKLAYRRTPWNQAVVLQTKRHYMPHVMAALMLVADDAARLRTWVRVGYVENGKRVMVGHGKAFPEGKQPWGPPPVPEPELTEAEWNAQNQGEFPSPMKPE